MPFSQFTYFQKKVYSLRIILLNLTDKDDFGGTALQEAIDVAYKETSKYLLEILVNKYKFVDHLKVVCMHSACVA
jgi:hypothetical protein